MSERTAQLDELLRQEISGVIAREVNDPRIGFVTVTDVEVARDLSHASVWVSIIGADDERRETMRVLGRAMPFVRHQLGKLHLRRIPELHLKEDRTAERATRILRLIEALESGTPTNEAEVAAVQETLPTPIGRPPAEPRRPRSARSGRQSSGKGTERDRSTRRRGEGR